MGIKLNAILVMRLAGIVLASFILFFDWLYAVKLIDLWQLEVTPPGLIGMSVTGLVGYATLNLFVYLWIKWSWDLK